MRICIYCKQESSNSKDRAHIVPEAFIRNDVTLALGVECDSCNHYASKLETAFVHHNRIWVPIMVLQIPGKAGKIRKRLGFYAAGNEKGTIKVRFPEDWLHRREDGSYYVQFPDPPQFDDLNFRRCLGHISLNYIAWKFGWNVALESRFDQVRRFVRYGNRNRMIPYGQLSFDDSEIRRTLRVGWEPAAPGLTIRIQSYIDDFFFDALNTGLLGEWINSQEAREKFFWN
jgi:hypothetical protein